ncbi:Glycopeptide [Mycena venus]|uniref:Glycopeptide n=1 Tax=Mycena venus TaxID=2733690 RepID=A0A8H6XMI5_9AGAR|nr:Glycopeptide [Mycena venus]
MLSLMTPFVLVALLVGTVRAETHTVEFINKCGSGTPTLIESGRVLSTGGELHDHLHNSSSHSENLTGEFTINGPLINGIAYLQTGACGTSGEGCTTVQTNLTNGNSCAEVSLVPPHAFSVTTGFGFFGGCDGVGQDCTSPNCGPPFQLPGQSEDVCCSAANVNLAITFCD